MESLVPRAERSFRFDDRGGTIRNEDLKAQYPSYVKTTRILEHGMVD